MGVKKTEKTKGIHKPAPPAEAPAGNDQEHTQQNQQSASTQNLHENLITSIYVKNTGFVAATEISRSTSVRSTSLWVTLLDSCGRSRLLGWHTLEAHGVLFRVTVHANVVSREYRAFQDLQRQRVLNHPLDGAPQRACPIGWIVALAHQELPRVMGQLQSNLPLREEFLDVPEQQVDDALQLLLAE